MQALKEIMTPEQVADYLQLNKDTVYRYIREGKIAASRFGRSYRVLRASIDLFLMATSTGRADRKALFNQIEAVAQKNKGIAVKEVERDIIESVAEMRGKMVDILRKHDVSRAAFFGSAATGKLRDDSDIDILVEFKGDKSLLDLVALKLELEDISGKEVDVVTYNSLHPFIKEEVLREQVAIL